MLYPLSGTDVLRLGLERVGALAGKRASGACTRRRTQCHCHTVTIKFSTTRAHNRTFCPILAIRDFLGLQIVGNMTLKFYIKNQLYG